MTFIKNKKVTLTPIGKLTKVISGQSESTPGIYVEKHMAQRGVYDIVITAKKGKITGWMKIWVHGMNTTKKLGNLYLDQIDFPTNKEKTIALRYKHAGLTGKVKIGILFSGCKKEDFFFIKSISIRHGKGKMHDHMGPFYKSNKATISWEETDETKKKEIELTVGMPAFKAPKVIWLALESLKLQTDITFGWELIIWEDRGDSSIVLKDFLGNLPNCQRIVYRHIDAAKEGRRIGKLKGTFPLIDKWQGMANEASPSSTVFVLQACDCFSPPKRLFIHHEHFKHTHCYVSTQLKGLFFHLTTKKAIFYLAQNHLRHTVGRSRVVTTHLNMAMLTKDIRAVPLIDKNKNIDRYLLACIRRFHKVKTLEGHILPFIVVDTKQWAYSIDTDGANTISLSRKNFYTNTTTPFIKYHVGKKTLGYASIETYIPEHVVKFLVDFK